MHECRDHQDEYDRLHILDMQRHEDMILDQVSGDRGDGKHERHGGPHPQRCRDFTRYAQKRADAQKL